MRWTMGLSGREEAARKRGRGQGEVIQFMRKEGGQVPWPLLGAGKDGAVPLSGGASQCPPPANPIPGHTEHVQELCKRRGGKQRDGFRRGLLTPPTSCSCPSLLPGSDKGAMVLPQVLLPSPSLIPDPSGCCLQGALEPARV